ncbi:MAG: V-type ATP synthase subunit I [Anaerolineae bacterium]|nr:V-type ATP synthase subunit I [Anaerolineae bacterium]
MNLTMTCLAIIGLKADLQTTVHTLRELGCVQIDPLDDAPELAVRPLTLSADDQHTQQELTALLAQVDGLLQTLGRSSPSATVTLHDGDRLVDPLDSIRAGVAALVPEVEQLAARRDKIRADLDTLPRYEATLRRLTPIVPTSAFEPGNMLVGILVSRAHLSLLDLINRRVTDLTGGQAETVTGDVDASTRAMLITFPEKYAAAIEGLLGQEDIARLRLPPELGEGPPDAAMAALQRRMTAIPQEITAVDAEIGKLADEWSPRLIRWQAILRDELALYNVLTQFGETDTTFALVGWLPTRDVQRVKDSLSAVTSDRTIFHELPLTAARKHHAPIALQNPPVARPFESLVGMLALPHYGSIDPTRLMALFLPLFFGMMLGDVGYGALLLAISLVLRRRLRPGTFRDLTTVLAFGSLWAIGFGVLYGEAFGELGTQFGMHALWIDRANSEHVTGLILMTLAVGAAHITLGLVLGVWEATRDRSRNHLLERGGMLIGLISLFVIVGALADVLPRGMTTPAFGGMIIGIVLLGLPMGWLGILVGPIEFIGLVGNVLSYLRIAAIGLASVYLAKVANEMAGALGSVVVGLIIAVLIHALNLVMGAFSPTIHSLRLHYVEFFRKFYEGGGRAYQPFRSQHS